MYMFIASAINALYSILFIIWVLAMVDVILQGAAHYVFENYLLTKFLCTSISLTEF